MRAAVRAAFVPFTAPLEGVVPWMYLDVKGLVTTAIGNLIDPIQYAMPLPWRNKVTGKLADRETVIREWARVKHDKSLARLGHRAAERITELRLTDEGVQYVVQSKLQQNWSHLERRFPDIVEWPADAQLGMLSMAWALGPAFNWPLFQAAVKARNFFLAAEECKMREVGNPGVAPRNRHNRTLFRNAGHVVQHRLDPDVLYWPRALTEQPVDREAPTLPELPDVEEPRESGPVLDGGLGNPAVAGDDIADAVRKLINSR